MTDQPAPALEPMMEIARRGLELHEDAAEAAFSTKALVEIKGNMIEYFDFAAKHFVDVARALIDASRRATPAPRPASEVVEAVAKAIAKSLHPHYTPTQTEHACWAYKDVACATIAAMPAQPATDSVVEALREALEHCVGLIESANLGAFQNGVTAQDGRDEGDYWCGQTLDIARAALALAGVKPE